MKKLIILVLLYIVIAPAKAGSDELYETQLSSGIKNFDTYSYMLIKKSHESRTDSINILKEAAKISPDLPEVYFELSKASLSFSVQGILYSLDYLGEGISAYSRNFRWSLTLYGSLYFCLVSSFLLTITLIVIMRLPRDIPLMSHDFMESPATVLLMPALAIISFFGPLMFLGGALILTGLYFRKTDKPVVYVYLLFLLLSPVVFKTASMLVNIVSSGTVKAIEQVNESRDNGYALSVLKGNDDYPVLFSYALALKRTGNYNEAITIYKKLLEKKPDARVYVNLGNCYVGLYNFDEGKKFNLEDAMKNYSAALKIKPLASAYYNLSQISREMLDFANGEKYFKSALELNRDAVTGYRMISGRNPNRMISDETLTNSELWEYARKRSHPISTFALSTASSSVTAVITIFLLAAFYLLDSRLREKAYRCKKCSAILCEKCEKKLIWGQMCPQCYGSLVKLDELDVKERVARILSINDQQSKRRMIMRILSFVLPGSPQIFGGRILHGFLFMWPFLFFSLVPVAMSVFTPNSYLVPHTFFKWTAVFIAAALYCVFNIMTRRRISKGWL